MVHFSLLQIVSGRLRQATSVLLHLIGAAVGYAGPLRGLRKSIAGVGKLRMLCGLLPFEDQPNLSILLPNSWRRLYEFFCFYTWYRKLDMISHGWIQGERERGLAMQTFSILVEKSGLTAKAVREASMRLSLFILLQLGEPFCTSHTSVATDIIINTNFLVAFPALLFKILVTFAISLLCHDFRFLDLLKS